MGIIKLAILGAALALIWFLFLNEKYDPIYFSGEVYEHVDSSSSDKLVNIYYTLDGKDMNSSSKFIHIFSANTEVNFQELRQKMLKGWPLEPIAGSTKRYFGMLKDKFPVYGLEKDKVFIMYAITKVSVNNTNTSHAQINQIINAMDDIPILHLN